MCASFLIVRIILIAFLHEVSFVTNNLHYLASLKETFKNLV